MLNMRTKKAFAKAAYILMLTANLITAFSVYANAIIKLKYTLNQIKNKNKTMGFSRR